MDLVSIREGCYICSKTDYIMAQEILDFKRWAIKIPRFNMDHRAIIAEIRLGQVLLTAPMSVVNDHFLESPFSETI